MSRALIIHHGRSTKSTWQIDEALVLRATPILRVLADHEVTWYTSERAAPLLWGNPLIERVVTSPRDARAGLTRERFDLVLNLEATPGCCALAGAVRTRRRAGYVWDPVLGRARLRPTRTLALPLLGPAYQDWLFALIDRRWSGEAYVLGYRPCSRVSYDVGLNHLVPAHAPASAWPLACWTALCDRLQPLFYTSMPASTGNVLAYIDWVHSCRTIVSGDSLGLHVALALGKRVVAILGSAESAALPLYDQGVSVTPPPGASDLAGITPGAVAAAVEEVLRLRRAG